MALSIKHIPPKINEILHIYKTQFFTPQIIVQNSMHLKDQAEWVHGHSSNTHLLHLLQPREVPLHGLLVELRERLRWGEDKKKQTLLTHLYERIPIIIFSPEWVDSFDIESGHHPAPLKWYGKQAPPIEGHLVAAGGGFFMKRKATHTIIASYL